MYLDCSSSTVTRPSAVTVVTHCLDHSTREPSSVSTTSSPSFSINVLPPPRRQSCSPEITPPTQGHSAPPVPTPRVDRTIIHDKTRPQNKTNVKTRQETHELRDKTQDKTRQDKTRQDKTRQDKTRQDKTRQDKTRQDKTRYEANARAINSSLCPTAGSHPCRRVVN